jgi:uncharacterized membrane protein YfcA
MILELELILFLLLAGSAAGLIAGLFGVGGGIVVIPVTLWILDTQSVDSTYIQHLAIGTSFSVMIFTTFFSSWGHFRKKAIRWDILKPMIPGIILGSIGGSLLASFIPSKGLQYVFVVFAYGVSLKTLIGFNPKSSWSLPKPPGIFGVGSLIGSISSLLGIGGGVFNVPFMLSCKVPVKEAIGTSAALSWGIAFTGAISYLFSGLKVDTLPAGSLGFCYLPIALVLVITTSIFAPLGVRLAHRWSSERLQIVFGILLLVVTTQMLLKWLL